MSDMAKVDVRIPDEQKEIIDRMAESESYGSRSEFVREAIRNEIRERTELKQLKQAKLRMEGIKEGSRETRSHEEVKQKARIENED